MFTDAALLAAVPDVIQFGALLKATPAEEGGERFLYFEASNEDLDHQNEIVAQQALLESRDYFLRHGNIDLSHYTLLGPKSGIANFMEYEIGKPVEVRIAGGGTFVKAQLYQGDSAMARNANLVWDSLTKQTPPARWYPSVGGAVLSKAVKLNPDTGDKIAVVDRVRWNNVALDRCPVSRTVGEISTAPLGVFAKSLGGFVLAKALEAGYGTDVATLTGGAALGRQSLDTDSPYRTFRDQLAQALRLKQVRARGRDISLWAINQFGLRPDQAAAWVERFLHDLAADRRGGKP